MDDDGLLRGALGWLNLTGLGFEGTTVPKTESVMYPMLIEHESRA